MTERLRAQPSPLLSAIAVWRGIWWEGHGQAQAMGILLLPMGRINLNLHPSRDPTRSHFYVLCETRQSNPSRALAIGFPEVDCRVITTTTFIILTIVIV